MKTNYALILIFIVLIGTTTAACSPIAPPGLPFPNPSGNSYNEYDLSDLETIKVQTFDSEEDMINLFAQSSGSNYYGGGFRGDMMLDMAMPETAMAKADGAMLAGSSENDFSETNNQVQGVDEADILKTDGEYIYTISGKNLHIIKAYPGEDAEVISTIKLEHTPSSLFIYEDKLAVFGSFYDNDYFDEIGFRPRNGMTYFDIYTIEDKTNPELEKELKLEGSYLNARLIGENVYFIVHNTPTFIAPYPMPIIIDGPQVREMDIDSIHYFDIPYNNPRLVTAHAINLIDEEVTDSEAVTVDYSQTIYMSEDNLYVISGHHINEWNIEKQLTKDLLEDDLTSADKTLIEKIKQTDSDILSQSEKDNKIMQVYYSFMSGMTEDEADAFQDELDEVLMDTLDRMEFFDFTVVNKIKANGDKLSFEGVGQVPGNAVNQFSFDEYKGDLRIATTIPARWSRYDKDRTEATNNVFVLNDDLELIGDLMGLAENERIYSTRFMGERLYMVTFRQIDPFFVIDLSDPEKPEVMGELKIPGFSRYLHPYDENHIIGIGQDTSETGRTKGLKVSLFDVEDVENPIEVANFVTDEKYAQSSALFEHKAFLFSKEKNLMVMPVYNPDYRWDQTSDESYNGAFVFKITEDTIELRGLIDHSKATSNSYGAAVERSLYINELLYTKSQSLLRINALDDLHGVKDVELSTKSTDIPIF